MRHEDVKICPSCGGEYRAEIESCAACGVAVVAPGGFVPDSGSLGPQEPDLVVLRVEGMDWCLRLMEDLQQAGVPARLDLATDPGECRTRSCAIRYAVRVRERDRGRALEIDRERLGRELPDWAEGEAAEGAEDRCPACGETVSPAALQCPGCELVLGGPDVD